jgi:hypothetical protein
VKDVVEKLEDKLRVIQRLLSVGNEGMKLEGE